MSGSVNSSKPPKFSGKDDDFHYWRRSFEAWIDVRDQLSKVLDAGSMSLDAAVAFSKVDENVKEDRLVFNYLYLAVDRKSAELIDRCCANGRSGAIAWNALLSDRLNRGMLRQNELRQTLHTISFSSYDSPGDYVNAVSHIATMLRECGTVINDAEILGAFMRGLPEKYAQWKWMNTYLGGSLDQVFERFLTMSRESLIPSAEPQPAFVSTVPSAPKQQSKGSRNKSKRKNGKRFDKSKVECWSCHKTGHFQSECPTKKSAGSSNKPLSFTFAVTGLNSDCHTWIVDSGCSQHMTPHAELISGPLKKVEIAVKTADGTMLKSLGTGVVNLKLKSVSGDLISTTLEDVLVIPGLKQNLLSVARVCEKGGMVSINSDNCSISKSGFVIPLVYVDRTFVVKSHAEVVENVLRVETLGFWHRRFGHVNVESIRKLLQSLNIPFIDEYEDVCPTCATMKAKNLPYPGVSDHRAIGPMMEVSVDLVGPMRVRSVDGKHFALVVVDSYSRMAIVKTLSRKSDAAAGFEPILNLFSGIKVVRSDRGGEFLGREFENLCNRRSIDRQYSAAGAPQQNGIAERKIAVLIQTARCMIKESKAPESFWSFALQYAAFCINRSPTAANDGKTPFELFGGSLPELSLMRIFGSICYFKINKSHLTKLEPRGKPGWFVGIPSGTKGFMVYDFETKKVIVSRNVVFDESKMMQPTVDVVTNDDSDVIIPVADPIGEGQNMRPNEPAIPVVPHLQEPVVVQPADHGMVPQNDDNDDNVDVVRTRSGRIIRPPENYWEVAHLASIESVDPKSHKEAMSSANQNDWKTAQAVEIDSLEKNKTWSIVPVPADRKVVGSRWVYQTKFNPDGTVNKRKARLVAQGFSQVPGLDFGEVFSPVARLSTVRTVIALSAASKRKMFHIDIKSAYLNAELSEDIFMKPPPDYEIPTGHVLKLHKGLYGLKQAGRNWNKLLTDVLAEFNLHVTNSDPCLFRSEDNKLWVVVYVDDLLISCEREQDYVNFKNFVSGKFDINDLGKLTWYLGIHVTYAAEGSVSLNQSLYIDQTVSRFRMDNAIGYDSPTCGKILVPPKDESEIITNVPYRELVGSLMWLSVTTRPDIAFAVSAVSRFLDRPTKEHWNAAKRILRYVKKTKNVSLTYTCSGQLEFTAFSDSDWAGDMSTRKSTSGFVCLLNGVPISWGSKLQKCTALSSAEAEYVAACNAALECVYIRDLLADLNEPQLSATQLFMDNRSAIALSYNPIEHKKTKHIELRVHKIRELVAENSVALKWIPTSDMLADLLTKPLGPRKHCQLAGKLVSF